MPATPKRRSFCYNGFGPVDNPSSYIYRPSKPRCVNGFTLCAIYAIYTSVGPSVISSNLQSYIANVLFSGVAQPNGLGQKPYAYGGTC